MEELQPAPVVLDKKIFVVCSHIDIGCTVSHALLPHGDVEVVSLEQLEQRDREDKLNVLVVEDLMKQIDTSLQQRIDLDSLLLSLPAEKPNNRAGRRGKKFDPLKSTSKFF